jgi:hypothetical protein
MTWCAVLWTRKSTWSHGWRGRLASLKTNCHFYDGSASPKQSRIYTGSSDVVQLCLGCHTNSPMCIHYGDRPVGLEYKTLLLLQLVSSLTKHSSSIFQKADQTRHDRCWKHAKRLYHYVSSFAAHSFPIFQNHKRRES